MSSTSKVKRVQHYSADRSQLTFSRGIERLTQPWFERREIDFYIS
jgi:hypothetical protein